MLGVVISGEINIFHLDGMFGALRFSVNTDLLV